MKVYTKKEEKMNSFQAAKIEINESIELSILNVALQQYYKQFQQYGDSEYTKKIAEMVSATDITNEVEMK